MGSLLKQNCDTRLQVLFFPKVFLWHLFDKTTEDRTEQQIERSNTINTQTLLHIDLLNTMYNALTTKTSSSGQYISYYNVFCDFIMSNIQTNVSSKTRLQQHCLLSLLLPLGPLHFDDTL